jgi:hypothetical protein
MLTRFALIAVFVVPGYPGHQLLRFVSILVSSFLPEVFSIMAAECRCQATTMKYLDITVLPGSIGETEIVTCGRFGHGYFYWRAGKGVVCAA